MKKSFLLLAILLNLNLLNVQNINSIIYENQFLPLSIDEEFCFHSPCTLKEPNTREADNSDQEPNQDLDSQDKDLSEHEEKDTGFGPWKIRNFSGG